MGVVGWKLSVFQMWSTCRCSLNSQEFHPAVAGLFVTRGVSNTKTFSFMSVVNCPILLQDLQLNLHAVPGNAEQVPRSSLLFYEPGSVLQCIEHVSSFARLNQSISTAY